VNYSVVKMDGDYKFAPPKWNLVQRALDKWKGVKYWPEDPKASPDCLEILEGNERVGFKTVYKRNG